MLRSPGRNGCTAVTWMTPRRKATRKTPASPTHPFLYSRVDIAFPMIRTLASSVVVGHSEYFSFISLSGKSHPTVPGAPPLVRPLYSADSATLSLRGSGESQERGASYSISAIVVGPLQFPPMPSGPHGHFNGRLHRRPPRRCFPCHGSM